MVLPWYCLKLCRWPQTQWKKGDEVPCIYGYYRWWIWCENFRGEKTRFQDQQCMWTSRKSHFTKECTEKTKQTEHNLRSNRTSFSTMQKASKTIKRHQKASILGNTMAIPWAKRMILWEIYGTHSKRQRFPVAGQDLQWLSISRKHCPFGSPSWETGCSANFADPWLENCLDLKAEVGEMKCTSLENPSSSTNLRMNLDG